MPLYQYEKPKHEDRTRIIGTKRLPLLRPVYPLALKEHATLPGYEIYRNDRIRCTGEEMAATMKDYVKYNSFR